MNLRANSKGANQGIAGGLMRLILNQFRLFSKRTPGCKSCDTAYDCLGNVLAMGSLSLELVSICATLLDSAYCCFSLGHLGSAGVVPPCPLSKVFPCPSNMGQLTEQ
jgi:hypothetical protein